MQPFLIYRCIFPEGRAMHELKKNTHKRYTVTTTAVLHDRAAARQEAKRRNQVNAEAQYHILQMN